MKHIFEQDIQLFNKELSKLERIFDKINKETAKRIDKAIDNMLDEFFLDTNVGIFFDGEELSIDVRNGDSDEYFISTPIQEALIPISDAGDFFTSDDYKKIAEIFRSISDDFLKKAKEVQEKV